MSLYEATTQIHNLNTAIEEAEGVVTEEAAGEFLGAYENFYDAVLQAAGWVKECDADENTLTAEITRLTFKRAALKARRDKFKKFMVEAMLEAGEEKIKGALYTVSVRKPSWSVEITDETLLSKECFIEQKPKISLTKIKELLEAHCEVKGAKLVGKQSLQIR